MPKIQAILFDLDGTLADTAPDLAAAANSLRTAAPLPLETLRPLASQGARGLLQATLGITPEDAYYPQAHAEFLKYYQKNICVYTTVFNGIPEVLQGIEARNLPWGIVTNKVTHLTLPLITQLGLAQRNAVTVSGDTTPNPKPAADPLLFAARVLDIDPAHCLYIGDDQRDIIAAHAAGMISVGVHWGYLGEHPIESWQAHHLVHCPKDLSALLESLC